MPAFIISGVPTCGKTTFGNYLEGMHGYKHIDMEAFQGTREHTEWESCLGDGRGVTGFVRPLLRQYPRLVFTWGFPPSCAGLIEAFSQSGVVPWWFEGDTADARTAYIGRARAKGKEPNLQSFDRQIADIASLRASIAEIYGPRRLTTLKDSSGALIPYEKMASHIGATST